MARVMNATTIAKLIQAHKGGDEQKFMAYSEHIAGAYHDSGDERAERIIRKSIDGTYKDSPKVVLD